MAGLDITKIRSHFPALNQKQVFFDNAGGSQVLKEVIDCIVAYLTSNNVQLGASYPVSVQSTDLFTEGSESVAKYINTTPDCVVLGPSTTQLLRNLSISLYDYITPDSEIIVDSSNHEANIASWVQLARDRGCTLKWWHSHSEHKTNPQLDCNVLRALMTENTRFVAVTQTSNILGTINDVKTIAKTVHEVAGALLCVDAVAYAPHRAIDVSDWEIDFYSFSWYKLYGPHIASMYASKSAQKHLRTLGHFFKPSDTLENLLGLAAANYELTASIPEVCKYLESVPWEETSLYEEKLQGILIEYLVSKPDVYQIYGEPTADRRKRVPVISFTVKGKKSKDVVDAIEARSDFGCRYGAMYSNRLCKEVLGLDQVDGAVRVSLLHYNTEEEVKGYVKVLDEVVFGS
ncbi:hypothetical protein DOTSEDRAFT_86802 [Dothistroma septosporum NZE10]|uniref:Aminotransferase class V domain-containing protein n=1 Tax=Dothistroma septosporum (strain NZE10 / CBS 128990) TaxID=675120 RepID=N1PTA9_DOTSN|nr:hypothetical protein DOTSEDRAFT_86802 [Dothistroma septosporum NZE10]